MKQTNIKIPGRIMTINESDLEDSLLSVIGASGGEDLLKEAAEFSFDQILDDGIVKDIPVVGTITSLYKVAIGMQGYIFARKIRKFLLELTKVSEQERSEFGNRLGKDSKFRTDVSDTLIILLDKLDDLEKCKLLANAFAGLIRGEYDLLIFRRLATAIDRCLVMDLRWLPHLKEKPTDLDSHIGDVLTGAGLARINTIPTIKAKDSKTKYEISSLGELFHQVVILGLPRDD